MAARLRARTALVVLVVALLAPVPPARAAPEAAPEAVATEQARKAFDDAEKSFALGRFDEAMKLYEQAYERKPLPAFLFNMGQCQRYLSHWDRAAFFFDQYLAKQPKAKNRPMALALLEQMRAKAKETGDRASPSSTAATQPADAARPTGGAGTTESHAPGAGGALSASVAPGGAAEAGAVGGSRAADGGRVGRVEIVPGPGAPSPAPSPTRERPVYKRWWLWTTVGVVVAGAVTAGVLGATLPTVSTDAYRTSLGGPIDAR